MVITSFRDESDESEVFMFALRIVNLTNLVEFHKF